MRSSETVDKFKILFFAPGGVLILTLIIICLFKAAKGIEITDVEKNFQAVLSLAIWVIYFYVAIFCAAVFGYLSDISPRFTPSLSLFGLGAGVASAVLIVVLLFARRSIFSSNFADILGFPAIVIVVGAENMVESPNERAFRRRSEQRAKVTTRLREDPFSTDYNLTSIELIDPLPNTPERSLVVDAILLKHEKAAMNWLARGAKVDFFDFESHQENPLVIAVLAEMNQVAAEIFSKAEDPAATALNLFYYGAKRCSPRVARFALSKTAQSKTAQSNSRSIFVSERADSGADVLFVVAKRCTSQAKVEEHFVMAQEQGYDFHRADKRGRTVFDELKENSALPNRDWQRSLLSRFGNKHR